MTDLETAVNSLGTHSGALCKKGKVITSDKRGVAPLTELIESGADISGFSAADRVVGKAAAMLMIHLGITDVFAVTLSESAEALLKKHGVSVKFKNRTERIMNRDNTGPCPMEQTVFGTDNIEEGVNAIMKKTGKYKK